MIYPTILCVLILVAAGVQGGPTCPEKDGEYPVYIPHNDCTKFWECSNGVPYLFDCPAELHFNPKLNVCDWPDQAGCKGGNSGEDPGSDVDTSESNSGEDSGSGIDTSESSSSESNEN